jgi:hypothetical protein
MMENEKIEELERERFYFEGMTNSVRTFDAEVIEYKDRIIKRELDRMDRYVKMGS